MPSPSAVRVAGGGVGLVRGVHHLEVAVGGGGRLVAVREQPADRLDRPAQGQRGGQEGDQGARGQLVVGDQDDADGQRAAERDLGQRRRSPPRGRRAAGPCRVRCRAVARPARRKRSAIVRCRPKALRIADAEHRLLDDGGQVADLVLGGAGGQRVARTRSTGRARISGTAGASAIRPSRQSRTNIITEPVTKVSELTIRKTSGKARNSRRVYMSEVARESSW